MFDTLKIVAYFIKGFRLSLTQIVYAELDIRLLRN
jgi:hypothetical protein